MAVCLNILRCAATGCLLMPFVTWGNKKYPARIDCSWYRITDIAADGRPQQSYIDWLRRFAPRHECFVFSHDRRFGTAIVHGIIFDQR